MSFGGFIFENFSSTSLTLSPTLNGSVLREVENLPCEQRLHFRGMRWRAKSSLYRQPFNFLLCMRKIRHAIRKQLVRQICTSFAGIKIGKTTCEQLSSSFCFVFLLCPSGFKYFSRKISSDRLLRKHYATNCSKSCLI